ncbi:ribonuclease H1 small subunit [Polychaeton citri CBS 116435]|uniref:Ribonuclease H1 small subunit n=1 Tax=Polychaeton citri CBS 116435 TaxID=1314669 RepID=A0A9P4Q629_9PEZI|nr:ribonuclease H1 small subunit [Polychaeton citri CBS 116435]
MLAIKNSPDSRQIVPNLLPCSIRHNGPVPVDGRYWKPETGEAGSHTAYLRGRKLHGREVKVPSGYQGVVLQATEEKSNAKQTVPQVPPEEDDDEELDEDQPAEVKIMQTQGTFDRMFVWGHESSPGLDQQHVKGIEEWIALAEAIHSR